MNLLKFVSIAMIIVPSVASVEGFDNDSTENLEMSHSDSIDNNGNEDPGRILRSCNYRCPKHSKPKRYKEPRNRGGRDRCDDWEEVCYEGYDNYCFDKYCFPSIDSSIETALPSCLYEDEYEECKREWNGKCKEWKRDCRDDESTDSSDRCLTFDDCECKDGYEKDYRKEKCVKKKSSKSSKSSKSPKLSKSSKLSSSDRCRNDFDCSASEYCYHKKCQDKKDEDSSCREDRMCLSGCCSSKKCARSSKCDAECHYDHQCPHGYECDDKECVEVLSSERCLSDSDCGHKEYCLQGECKDKKGRGETCSDSRKCLSGCCKHDECTYTDRCDSSSGGDRMCRDNYKYTRCVNSWNDWCEDWEDICEDSSDSYSDYCADEHCFSATFEEGNISCLNEDEYEDCLEEWKERCFKFDKMCPRPSDQCWEDWC